jgi:ubiquinone/menaquinone biosynthesis C-methylase UbiE
MNPPPFNLAAIEAYTPAVYAAGHRLLQTHRFAQDDVAQVRAIMGDFMPSGDVVLDAGCGLGGMASILAEADPGSSFILMNLSRAQLDLCPVGERFKHVLGDCHAMDLDDESVDLVLFTSALCQMDMPVALAEAARVLRPGGRLVISDMARTHGDPGEMEQTLAARVLPGEAIERCVRAAGFTIDMIELPDADDSHFSAMLAEANLAHLAREIRPLIVRAYKQGVCHGL